MNYINKITREPTRVQCDKEPLKHRRQCNKNKFCCICWKSKIFFLALTSQQLQRNSVKETMQFLWVPAILLHFLHSVNRSSYLCCKKMNSTKGITKKKLVRVKDLRSFTCMSSDGCNVMIFLLDLQYFVRRHRQAYS